MTFLPIQLRVPKRVIRAFERQAKAAFPKETFAFLIGYDAGTNVEVTDLFVPAGVEAACDESQVQFDQAWLADALEYAGQTEATVVGDIHSHPFRQAPLQMADLAAPSAGDLIGQRMIAGVTAVTRSQTGRKRVLTRFWGPVVHVETIVEDGKP